jgi:hypothetical protein
MRACINYLFVVKTKSGIAKSRTNTSGLNKIEKVMD